ncbi:MAG: amidophosphoribosyltransferase [Alphaproteobacteria bacterium]|nr:amidophosphoribosyltransferase [Alphaproteobacteria bacterium]MCL2505370.1 amidophosphoribosyltransferase [Alphaproteobacteria bacterium]
MFGNNPFEDDKLKEECGIFGIIGNPSASALTALGLHALQHRGQESAGIVSCDNGSFNAHHAIGLVAGNFGNDAVISRLTGDTAIGHTRYATTGEGSLRNVQPLFADLEFGGFAVAHNGNLTNANMLRDQMVQQGCLFRSTTDTEVILHLMAISIEKEPLKRFIDALRRIQGAYSIVGLGEDILIGARDPNGIRPLVLGKLDNSFVLASETCALDIIGASFVRDIEPGEVVFIRDGEVKSFHPFKNMPSKFCIFEYIYFARPDSYMEGRSVYETRKNIGKELAKESPVEADVVVPVPDSGVPTAIGYAEQSGLPFDLGIIRNHYVGRTFIQPTDKIRHLGVKLKHNANKRFIEGKRIVLLDDSIVRGTTSVKIVEMLRNAGAKEVHMKISSPPTMYGCFYGIDTPESEKLLAHSHSIEEMRRFIGIDSLSFISFDGMYKAICGKPRNRDNPQFCDACFSGDYPIPLTDYRNKDNKKTLSSLS